MQKQSTIKIAPSILSADSGALAQAARAIEDAGADSIHIDIMDGHFVPNLTFGPKVVAAINKVTSLYLDIHLMIYNPFDYIERFVESGADSITFHFEATELVEDTLNYIHRCGIDAGIAFCPGTTETFIPKFLPFCQKVLLMTVNPGFGGQEFMPEVLEKIRFTQEMWQRLYASDPKRIKRPLEIQVDGGITDETAPLCIEAGANSLVSGTYLFKSPDMKGAILTLKGNR